MKNNWPTQAAELGILAGLLSGKDRWGIADKYEITTESFVADHYRQIFAELAKRHENADTFDYLSIANFFANGGTPEVNQALADSLINEGQSSVPAVFEGYCEAIWNHKVKAHNSSVAQAVQVAVKKGEDPTEIALNFKQPHHTAKNKKSRLTIRTISELLNMEFDESDNHFGDRIIAASQPVTILGPGGIGKSRLLMQLAFCMITGRPFLGIETHAREKKWLIFQTENSNRRLKMDITKMVMGMRFQKEDTQLIDRCFVIHTVEKDEDTFLDLETQEIEHIEQAIADHNPHFVAFDPLNTFTSLELNNDRDMKAVVTALSRAVKKGNPHRVPVVIHHSATGKLGAAKAVGWDKSSFGRNSKALFAWTRAQINLAPQDPDNSALMVMACGKNNNGAHFPEMGLMFDEPTGIYQVNPDFDPEEFRQSVGLEKRNDSKKITVTPAQVADLFDGSIDRAALVRGIIAETGCSRATAYRCFLNAEKHGAIFRQFSPNKSNPIFGKLDAQKSFA